MSDFETFCSTILADITTNVPSLGTVTSHSLAPWDPERLEDDGKRHLAVWPAGEAEGSESAEPLHMSADNVTQLFRVLLWESATSEASRGVLDQQATSAWLTLHNAIRARFYNPSLAVTGYWKIRYRGTDFPERSSSVRWMRLEVSAVTAVAYA